MNLKLDCSKKYIPYLKEKLPLSGFTISNESELMIVDNPLHSFSNNNILDDYKSIVLIESFGNDIHIHKAHSNEPTLILDKLYNLEAKFKGDGFIRVNKSQIVNIRFIVDIEPWIGQKYILTLKNGHIVDVNRTYYKRFKQYLKL